MPANPVIDINLHLDKMIAFLGSQGNYTTAKTPTTTTVVGLLSPFDRRDTDLIQSYGVGGCRLTFKASAFLARPNKFDSWTCAGRKYIFDSIADIIVKGELIGYTVFSKGQVG